MNQLGDLTGGRSRTEHVEAGTEVDYESLPTDRISAHLIAGGAAGIMEHCVMYPVDCVKVNSFICHHEYFIIYIHV